MKTASSYSNKQKSIRMRERMMDAGIYLFLQHGFRGVSMAAIAEKAEVAKPTLYKYFADKEVLFQAGVVRFLVEAKARCEKEFAGPGSAGDKIAGALAVKHKMFFKLVAGSSFAEELYSETARISAKDFTDFEVWLETQISEILSQSGETRSVIYAQLILACALGISKKAQRVEEIGPAIRLVTQKILA